MKASVKKTKRVVYVVFGSRNQEFHPRVHKLLCLRPHFEKMVLVARGSHRIDQENLVLNPYPNPTGVFRLLGLNKLKSTIDKYLFFPSTNLLYVKRVEKIITCKIKKDLDQGMEVCLLTSVPPHDLCLLGLSLKNKFPSIKWIVDWRDLWSYDENYLLRVPRLYRGRLLRLEKRVFTHSDLNIVTNKYAKTVLESHFKVPPSRAVFINHHYCTKTLGSPSEQYDSLPSSPLSAMHAKIDANQLIKIGFLGQLFKPPRVPGLKLVKIINDLRKSGVNVELHIFGKVVDKVKQSLSTDSIHSVVFHENLTELQRVQKVAQCDYLLVLLEDLENSKAVMCLKLPQYLLMNKPIIGIVPNQSATADIINETATGYIIPVDGDWAKTLLRILTKPENMYKRFTPNRENIEIFNWENISKQWLEVLCNPL
ncbi:MAG: hypothetical protein V3U88_02410 [Methylococcales bacterium]